MGEGVGIGMKRAGKSSKTKFQNKIVQVTDFELSYKQYVLST